MRGFPGLRLTAIGAANLLRWEADVVAVRYQTATDICRLANPLQLSAGVNQVHATTAIKIGHFTPPVYI
jgi:hypothetical protein